MTMKSTTIKVTTTGGAGVATGSGVSASPIMGKIRGIQYAYHASAPATTDVTVKRTGGANLHVRSNSVTPGMVVPAAAPEDAAGAAIAGAALPPPIADSVTVTVAQCDALTDAVVVTVYWD